MPVSVLLQTSGTATVPASGRARVTLQPMQAFERWDVTRINVQNTSTVLVPACRVYRGSEAPSNLVAATATGTLDTSNESDLILENGEALVAVWEGLDIGSAGADVGSICTLTITGKKLLGI